MRTNSEIEPKTGSASDSPPSPYRSASAIGKVKAANGE
jgi:hypothetical protein